MNKICSWESKKIENQQNFDESNKNIVGNRILSPFHIPINTTQYFIGYRKKQKNSGLGNKI